MLKFRFPHAYATWLLRFRFPSSFALGPLCILGKLGNLHFQALLPQNKTF